MKAADLRKLASVLRKRAETEDQSVREKCARLVVASTGLSVLSRKIYG